MTAATSGAPEPGGNDQREDQHAEGQLAFSSGFDGANG